MTGSVTGGGRKGHGSEKNNSDGYFHSPSGSRGVHWCLNCLESPRRPDGQGSDPTPANDLCSGMVRRGAKSKGQPDHQKG